MLLEVVMIVAHCPELYSVRKANSKDGRVGIPLDGGDFPVLAIDVVFPLCPQIKLSMTQTVALEEHNLQSPFAMLHTSNEVSRRTP